MGRAEEIALAKDVGSPSSVLAELAQSWDAWVRREVAKNPNAPLEALVSLAEDFGEEVLTNEAFALYDVVEQVFPRFSGRALRQFARSPSVPPHFTTWVRRQSQQFLQGHHLVENLMVNTALPVELRQELFCAHAPQLELSGHWGPTSYQLGLWLGPEFVELFRRGGCCILGSGSPASDLSAMELQVLRAHGPYGRSLAEGRG